MSMRSRPGHRPGGGTALAMARPTALAAALTAALVLLAACAPLQPSPSQPAPTSPAARPEAGAPPPSFPLDFYRGIARRGEAVLAVDPTRSLVVVEVRRAGSLAKLGHDHVIAAHDLRGFVAPDERRADLYVRLDTLTVDEPQLRAKAGFDTEPTAEDIAGTRRNMLGRVLHADAHPYALVAVTRSAEGRDLDVAITLNGITRHVAVQAALDRDAGGYDATGAFAIEQTDFGIRPFSIMGGALAVANRLDIRFAVHARRIAQFPAAGR